LKESSDKPSESVNSQESPEQKLSQENAPSCESPDDKPKKGHGRNGVVAYTGAPRIRPLSALRALMQSRRQQPPLTGERRM